MKKKLKILIGCLSANKINYYKRGVGREKEKKKILKNLQNKYKN